MKKKFSNGVMKKVVEIFNNNDLIPINFEYENKTKFKPGRKMVMISNHSGWFALDGLIAGELIWDDLYDCYLKSKDLKHENDGRKIFAAVVHEALIKSPIAKLFPEVMRKEAMISRDEYMSLLKDKKTEELPYYVGIFPESEIGSTKSFLQAYKLKDFKTGFIRTALMTDSDILVSTITGNEELLPSLCSVKVENKSKNTKLIFPIPMPPLFLNPFMKKSMEESQSYKLTLHEIVPIEEIKERIDAGESLKEIADWFRDKTQAHLDKETFHRPLSVTARYFDRFREKANDILNFEISVKF